MKVDVLEKVQRKFHISQNLRSNPQKVSFNQCFYFIEMFERKDQMIVSRSITPVLEYIMNMFSEPYCIPSNHHYSSISHILTNFIQNKIPYNDCYKRIKKITPDNVPLLKLKSILDVPQQPLKPIQLFDNYDETNNIKMCGSVKKKKAMNWTVIEDERLLSGILRFGIDNWTTIANYVGNNRTRSQCNQRWTRGLNPHISKQQWTIQETQKLLGLVQTHGEKSWTHISSVMGNRSDIQCRYHYYHVTKKHPCNVDLNTTNVDLNIMNMNHIPNNLKFLHHTLNISTNMNVPSVDHFNAHDYLKDSPIEKKQEYFFHFNSKFSDVTSLFDETDEWFVDNSKDCDGFTCI
ncbi:r2r3-MYB transcription factor [Tritrichomonas foetus]|uniref:R2r3-MYB transcription factor n=1 Tax=Tritrichomonas foetus TaxID=1144522 RepID=A0A1J4KYU8_9EUKA|nr:r2r3-MYB transcription factor [Tritrichomonas foetus]|eukprot:OHT16427.1 r2r3-MYB transcription factor [Tritrichomonas foetus]